MKCLQKKQAKINTWKHGQNIKSEAVAGAKTKSVYNIVESAHEQAKGQKNKL